MFETLNLDEKLMRSIKQHQYETPTEIQKEVIPIIIEGNDLIASAKTGSGKTVAFIVPAIQRLMTPSINTKSKGPRVLVLTPTRELADQVATAARGMAKFTNLRIGVVTGGVGYPPQERMLRSPVDILVATPGRLLDHMNRGRLDYSRLELLVLDEADRMLDMGFMPDLEKILDSLPSERQIILFSATLEGPIEAIARKFLNKPACVQLTSKAIKHAQIAQHMHDADDFNHKRALLIHLLEESKVFQAIVFTATKRGAEDLAEDLSSRKIDCAPLHGDMKQSKRTRTLERMRRGQLRVLIATDVAARGLDVKNLSHVINFDLPKSGEDYIHRIGRTGRGSETGVAISLVGPKDRTQLRQIERFTGQQIQRQIIVGLEPKTNNSQFEPRNSRGSRNSGSRDNAKRSYGKNNFGNKGRSNSAPRGNFGPRTGFGSKGSYSSKNSKDSNSNFDRKSSNSGRSGNSSHSSHSNHSSYASNNESRRNNGDRRNRTTRDNKFKKEGFNKNPRNKQSNKAGNEKSNSYSNPRFSIKNNERNNISNVNRSRQGKNNSNRKILSLSSS